MKEAVTRPLKADGLVRLNGMGQRQRNETLELLGRRGCYLGCCDEARGSLRPWVGQIGPKEVLLHLAHTRVAPCKQIFYSSM